MTIKNSLFLTAAGIMLAACQSNECHISGQVTGLEDGDTLFLTTDMQTGTPSDTILIKDGRFEADKSVDSVCLAMIYSKRQNEINAPFFLESGTVNIKLDETPGASRVSGTHCNNAWQELNDSVMSIGKAINQIAEHIYGNNVDEEEQQKGMDQIEAYNQRFANIIVKAAEDNIQNEFGYFLLTYYPEELISNDQRLRLIEQLPDKMRQRSAIRQMEQSIKRSQTTAEDSIIKDFSQPAPSGATVSVMDIVKSHKLTIIDFWASWCAPCRQEMPNMVTLYSQYQDKGLAIVGVSLDENKDAWTQAIAQMKMEWPQMSDLKGWENAAAQAFSVSSIPHTILVDQQGRILKRGLRGQELENFVAEHLK